jgi:hypothetical protein
VSSLALARLFYSLPQLLDSFAHALIISTRSRTVQKVFVTPLAIAGAHRTAMLDFKKL